MGIFLLLEQEFQRGFHNQDTSRGDVAGAYHTLLLTETAIQV